MAISKKGSRNITVKDHEFKWRATGNDGWITVIVWPVSNENSRIVASIDYHHDMKKVGEGRYSSQSQLVVTNRIIRELVLHVGIEKILNNQGQLNLGRIEEFYNVSNAVRG
jgi:hypothetical protein